ncbi:Polyol:NADP oxidoreductase [Bordetella ansorpii]|uniref:Polyol:NADP oxidoreductase n=1 Tax=Bordetella ansorpii TaxID=288768 RepID=A0A157SGP8_9BORD|nr:mannitol dehydrogenase family protein [Bordetella ansorpii]SAI69652.1 Polyol:NADP oxidoreductase [Bordetella ansorpii]
MRRLHPALLAGLPADVQRPGYDRKALQAGIVQLGIGDAPRAWLAAVTDAAIEASGDLRWGIVGVSLSSNPAHGHEALARQNGVYTLALRDTGPNGLVRERLRVIGAVLRVLDARRNPQAVLDQIAHEDTRVISVTLRDDDTAGHGGGEAAGDDDPACALAPRGAIGLLVHGLKQRRGQGGTAVTVLSCNDRPASGRALRSLVLACASCVDEALAAWIDGNCTFPNGMADRIVLASDDADRARISQAVGLQDGCPVQAEPYLDWVIEDSFVAGRPPWEAAAGPHGMVRVVPDSAPFARLKQRMADGPRAALAYLGAVSGMATLSGTFSQPPVRALIDAMMREEIASTLDDVPGVDLAQYHARQLERLSNLALSQGTHRSAAHGSSTVPPCLLAPLRERARAGQTYDRLALAVAAWLHYLRGQDELGLSYPICDPLADELARRQGDAQHAADAAGDDPGQAAWRVMDAMALHTDLFGDLTHQPDVAGELARKLALLRWAGVRGAVLDAA